MASRHHLAVNRRQTVYTIYVSLMLASVIFHLIQQHTDNIPLSENRALYKKFRIDLDDDFELIFTVQF